MTTPSDTPIAELERRMADALSHGHIGAIYREIARDAIRDLTAAQRDAARYRFWREHIQSAVDDEDGIHGIGFSFQIPLQQLRDLSVPELADAIADAAIIEHPDGSSAPIDDAPTAPAVSEAVDIPSIIKMVQSIRPTCRSVYDKPTYDMAIQNVVIALGILSEPKRHRWDNDGERCLDCGDKDWMADAVCGGASPTPAAEE